MDQEIPKGISCFFGSIACTAYSNIIIYFFVFFNINFLNNKPGNLTYS